VIDPWLQLDDSSMQLTALRAAADTERWATRRVLDQVLVCRRCARPIVENAELAASEYMMRKAL
jgi:hypothetical protein